MIVARHDVPGTAPPQKSRPVGYGMTCAGLRTDFDDWSDEILNTRPSLANHFGFCAG